MDRARAVLQTTERIYAAATTPAEWPAALAAIARLMGGNHAVMLARDGDSAPGAFIGSEGLGEADLAGFRSPDGMRIAAPLYGAVPIGMAVSSAAFVSDRDWARSEFYNELVRPIDGFYSATIRQEKPHVCFTLAVCRSPRTRHFESPEVMTLQAFLPQLTNALELQRRLQVAEQQQAGLTHVLDRLEAGVILTDESARPSFINARAARITVEADGLSVEAGGLAAATPALTRRLRAAIAAVGADAGMEGQRLQLQRPSHRPPLLLRLLPVWNLGATVPGAGAPHVAIFIKEPDARVAIDRLLVADAFRLTPRESDVAVLLARGFDLVSIAGTLGLGLGTVRHHLKGVFEKTGMRSQATLVALIRGFAEPGR